MKKLSLYGKGLLMGICDLIPGISGGTIAFITGIYERLMKAVKAFSLGLVKSFFSGNKEEIKKHVKALDLGFLFILFAGIATSILLGSRLVSFLLENHFARTISFFVGLILASSLTIYKHIEKHDFRNIIFGVLGLLFGISLNFIVPKIVTPSFTYLFLSGFLAISAMFLPGISGSFILLILGVYQYMLGILHNPFDHLIPVGVFGIGAVTGAYVISRIVTWLFVKDRCKTLYVLLGLVLGSLAIPLKPLFASFVGILDIGASLVFFIIGIIFVSLIERRSLL